MRHLELSEEEINQVRSANLSSEELLPEKIRDIPVYDVAVMLNAAAAYPSVFAPGITTEYTPLMARLDGVGVLVAMERPRVHTITGPGPFNGYQCKATPL